VFNHIKVQLSPIFTRRFAKFCSVGASGVVVNLGFLYLFADAIGLHTNAASALAIELSILSNFLINETWTFSDLRENGSFAKRAIRFNLVSLVGAMIQWSLFVMLNVAWMLMLAEPQELAAYHGGYTGWIDRWIIHPVLKPPDVGTMKYVSQLFGIGVATFWNFLVNVHWTWGPKQKEGDDA